MIQRKKTLLELLFCIVMVVSFCLGLFFGLPETKSVQAETTVDVTENFTAADNGLGNNGTNHCFLLRTRSDFWTSDIFAYTDNYSALLDLITVNGKTVKEINTASYTYANDYFDGGNSYQQQSASYTLCSLILVRIQKVANNNKSSIQLYIPVKFIERELDGSLDNIGIKSGWSYTDNEITYTVSQDILFAYNGSAFTKQTNVDVTEKFTVTDEGAFASGVRIYRLITKENLWMTDVYINSTNFDLLNYITVNGKSIAEYNRTTYTDETFGATHGQICQGGDWAPIFTRLRYIDSANGSAIRIYLPVNFIDEELGGEVTAIGLKTNWSYTVNGITYTVSRDVNYLLYAGSFVEESDVPVELDMSIGAMVQLGNGTAETGFSFLTYVTKESVERLNGLLSSGAYSDYRFGTLIVPENKLSGGMEFSFDYFGLNGISYVDVESAGFLVSYETATAYAYSGSIIGLQSTDYTTKYIGIGYVCIEKDGEENYQYAEYLPSNARSMSYIATEAIADRQASSSEIYPNYIEENNNYSPYTVTQIAMLKGYLGEGDSVLAKQNVTTLIAGGEVTYNVDQQLAGAYIKLKLTTNVDLYGTFAYRDVQNTKNVNENFYISSGETEFKQYLDLFRNNGLGYGINCIDIILQSITFKNISTIAGDMQILDVSAQNKGIPETNKEVYITCGDIKLGMDLALGGSLTYLSRTNYNGQTINEYLTSDGKIKLGVGLTGEQLLSSSVNLINIYDAGRELQQSYYAAVGSENGYTNGSYNGNDTWPYNPVQAGDKYDNPSQIIDYEIRDNQLYVKTRAMDWAQNNSTTKSYMENWYTINANNTVNVGNRFVDWNGFENMESIGFQSNELPASYLSHTLHTYVSYTGNTPWTNDSLLDKNDVGSMSADGAYRQSIPEAHQEDWYAWVNDEKFGVGVYIPNVTRFTAARSYSGSDIASSYNTGATNCPLITKGLLYNKMVPSSSYASCYVFNNSYVAPAISYKMEEYVSLHYQYVISVDYVDTMRSQFKALYDCGQLTNLGLDNWAREDKSSTWN